MNVNKKNIFAVLLTFTLTIAYQVFGAYVTSPEGLKYPNPGHWPGEIGPGTFNCSQTGINCFWKFPAKVIIEGILDMYGHNITNVGNIKVRDTSGDYDWLLENGIIKEKFLPYCPQEITSDVYTNGQNQQTGCNFGGYTGYYDISNLTPENVRKGVGFGRGQVGALEAGMSPWEECKVKVEKDVSIPDDNCHCMYSDLGYKFLVCYHSEEYHGWCGDKIYASKCNTTLICTCDYNAGTHNFWGLECPWSEDPRDKLYVNVTKNEDTDKSCNQICSELGAGWNCASVGLDANALNSLCWDKYHGESWICNCGTVMDSHFGAWTNCRCVKELE